MIAVGGSPSIAAEWVADRLRGDVRIIVEGDWIPIHRGDTIHSGTIIRTGTHGYAEFHDGPNVVSLTPDSQVKFIDWSERGQSWVQQWFGEVEVDVEARDVEHFGVRTPNMVAVVKGTRFTVSSDGEASSVSVSRGLVAVEDTERHHHVSVGSGQSVSGSSESVMTVSGSGDLPQVVNASGKPVAPPVTAPEAEGNSAVGASAGAPENSGSAQGKSRALSVAAGPSGNATAAAASASSNGQGSAHGAGHGGGPDSQGPGSHGAGGRGAGNNNSGSGSGGGLVGGIVDDVVEPVVDDVVDTVGGLLGGIL